MWDFHSRSSLLNCIFAEPVSTSNDSVEQSAGDEKVKEKFSLDSEKVQLTCGKQIYQLMGKVAYISDSCQTILFVNAFHFCARGSSKIELFDCNFASLSLEMSHSSLTQLAPRVFITFSVITTSTVQS